MEFTFFKLFIFTLINHAAFMVKKRILKVWLRRPHQALTRVKRHSDECTFSSWSWLIGKKHVQLELVAQVVQLLEYQNSEHHHSVNTFASRVALPILGKALNKERSEGLQWDK